MITWKETDGYLQGTASSPKYELPSAPKIAAFDFDDTLVRKGRGKNKNLDWEVVDEKVPVVISNLVDKKYLIVVFTNQSGMTVTKNFDIDGWKDKITAVVKTLFKKCTEYYFIVLAAKRTDMYRKPNIAMWNVMTSIIGTTTVSKKSFYCGDAAGRVTKDEYQKKGDFSDSDRKFAINLKLDFYTPEDVFIRDFQVKDIKFKLDGIDPKLVLKNICTEEYNFTPRKKELLVMVGYPGSGKSEFVKKYVLPHKYVYVNQDTLKTKAKCVSTAKTALGSGKSVVIDNTNVDDANRIVYVQMALENGYKHIRCIVFDIDLNLAKHLNNVRHIYSDGAIPKIADVSYNVLAKKYVAPEKEDHFDKIETIKFCLDPEKLKDKEWKRVFMQLS